MFKEGDEVIIINGNYSITTNGSKGTILNIKDDCYTVNFYYIPDWNGIKIFDIRIEDLKKISNFQDNLNIIKSEIERCKNEIS